MLKTVRCFVLKCPKCGKERPYPVKEELDIRDPPIMMRLKMGFGEHMILAHGEKLSNDELTEFILKNFKELQVPEYIVKKVEMRTKNAKWDYYGLL